MLSKTCYPISAYVFLILLAFCLSTPAYSQDGTQWSDFSSKGNPKTAGHNFKLQHPPYLGKASDFPQDKYIQLFDDSGEEESSGDNYQYLTVGIQNLPNNIAPSALKTDNLWDFNKLDNFWKSLAKQIPDVKTLAQAISWGNIPMAKFSTSKIDTDGIKFLSGILFALHGDKLIKLECGLNSFGDIDIGNLNYAKEPTCSTYFNSLEFIDAPLP